MLSNKKHFIAEMLLEKGLITKEQLDTAMALQKTTDKKVGQILIELGYIKQEKLLQLLAEQLNLPLVDLKTYPLQPELVKLLPEFYARHFRAIILNDDDTGFLVGMVDPQDLLAIDEIERIIKNKATFALILEDDLLDVLDNIYRRSDEISHFAESLSAEMTPANSAIQDIFDRTQNFATADMPVVNLLRSIFEDAVQVNASDIHIEPDENVLRIRLRVDGVLQEQIVEEKAISQALVQRIKLMSGLNIAEKRLPQDGRFSITVKKKYYDVRVSTIPIQYGESLVMRLLNQSAHLLNLKQIGMPEQVYLEVVKILTAAYGILLIVGPTGSGKSTTLYAALNQLNKPQDKIITVEDPVEYRLSRINQVQVNNKIGLTFASILRSILRQDPDIIMIGEMRDQETIEIALRAAMTGHFVMATLHTNDSISSITRLIDMGAQGYLVASVLRAVIAQRLVRKICTKCSEPATLTPHEIVWLKSFTWKDYTTLTFHHGAGCTHCQQTGYTGRTGIYELLVISEALGDALRNNDMTSFSHLAKQAPFYHSLLQTALDLAEQGVTTIDEVMRMSGEI
jgi:MSHA biogenesis protein MshE